MTSLRTEVLGVSSGNSVVVGVGDGRVASAPSEYLVTYALGSCIAAIFYDFRMRLGGMVHLMLPDSSIDPAKASRNPYVFADTGLHTLVTKLYDAGCTRRSLRSCIAGGASMLEHSAHFEIGKRNHLAAKRAFWQMGLLIDSEDVGGAETRSVFLSLRNGQVDLRTGSDKSRILMKPGRIG